MAYDSLCTRKGMGGLSFRGLRLFNIALIGRQVWQLINNKDTLSYHVLCSKYFSNGGELHHHSLGRVFCMQLKHLRPSLDDSLVSDLWRFNSREWDRDRVEELYGDRLSAIFSSVVCIEIIVRDHDGFVLGGRMIFLDYKMVEWAEAKALREGIIWAHNNNVTKAFFETDYTSLSLVRFSIEENLQFVGFFHQF
ncbi:hypothetical protein Golob_014419 [Gossypium lobatum]|uniref:RNase H type-1 domain-containing protein n=1 Tax=Gossypium lobatum TaxID=34289 RepID=A0A7J8LY24_9ROSI|nr:hypothetical protein [Gossypium lobatum]